MFNPTKELEKYKKMTEREQVLALYPTAKCYTVATLKLCNVKISDMYQVGIKKGTDIYLFGDLHDSKGSRVFAWKKALENIKAGKIKIEP